MRLLRNEPRKLRLTMPVFVLIRDIRIVIKVRDLKVLREILEAIGATGRTAAVQEQSRHTLFAYVFFNYFFQLALIVYPVHIFKSLPHCLRRRLKLSVAGLKIHLIDELSSADEGRKIPACDLNDPVICMS